MRTRRRLKDISKKVNSNKNRVWFCLNIIFTSIYLTWRLFFTLPLHSGLVSRIAGILLITVEILGAIEAFIHYWNMYTSKDVPLPEVPLEEFPDVDVFIATYNEPTDLLFKTINGCIYMDYPDKRKVHIYVCDDNRRPEVRRLAEKMGVHYLERPDNKGAKAGNLNHAMSVTNSPYIATFDADMIPNHNFLLRTIPYFVDATIRNKDRSKEDKIKLGFVQSPQSFYNPDLFQFYLFSEGRIPNEQDYFYRDVQLARNKSNSVIYGGSNTVLSREALEEIGGFYTGSITEDFATGMLIEKAKYRCIAISEVLASGLSPTTLKDLISQRVRWARGVINTVRKVGIVFSTKLTCSQKLNYLASVWYWYSPIKIFIYIMAPILFAVFGYVVIECNLRQIIIFWLPMYISSAVTLRMLSGNIRTAKWSRVYETILFPHLFFPVLLESFGISMKTFKVTKKGNYESEQGPDFIYSIPYLIFVVLSFIGIYNSIHMMFVTSSLSSIVILFWLVANLFSLVMALFFVQGRSFLRKSERVTVALECELQDKYQKVSGYTKDISETGVSIMLKEPLFIPDDDRTKIKIWSDRYSAEVWTRVVHASKGEDGWKYAFTIVELDEKNKAEFMQLLYDRVPTLPHDLGDSISGFDDLRINVTSRTKDVIYENRKFPRIPINGYATTVHGDTIWLIDFNYQCVTLDTKINRERITIKLENGLNLECRFERCLKSEHSLYTIENIDEVYADSVNHRLLFDWLNDQLKENKDEKRSDVVGKDEFDELSKI